MALVCDDCESAKAIYRCKICKASLCECCAEHDHSCLEDWKEKNYDEI